MTNKYELPKPTIKDHAHTLVRAGLGSIPYVGAAAVELFQTVVAPSLERRRGNLMEGIAEGLRKLEEKNICRIEELASNETFIDTLLQASHTAMRNSNEEKREALYNAVLNSALPNPPEESRQQMFIQLVDGFTVWHLRILKFFADPRQWFQERGKEPPLYTIAGSLSQMLTTAYPELKDQRDLYDQITKDLSNRGLIGADSLHTTMSGQGACACRATELGQQFLRFIATPSASVPNHGS
jgi:hypothetical protein